MSSSTEKSVVQLSQLAADLKPYTLALLAEAGIPTPGSYAPSPHDLSSVHHTGSLNDLQAPQFLKLDGTRTLIGNLTVLEGVTIDGVDLSVLIQDFDLHILSSAVSAHGSVGAHNHQIDANGGLLDHGLALSGLGDDDHPQYLNNARHDTTLRHTLGTVVPHDEHSNLSGLSDDDHLQYLHLSGIRGMQGHLLPDLPDTYDLGSSTLLWRKGWLSELEAVLFAKNTITLLGGWLIVSKNEGTLPVKVLPADTNIDFGQAMTTGDFILFRSAGSVEYMVITGLVSGTSYSVDRNLDGSGADTWTAGTPYAVLGGSGSGRIELNAYTTPRMSIIRQGASYNVQTELIRIGDLNQWSDYATEMYGAAFGDPSGANITVDPTNGVRLRRGSTNVIQLSTTEAIIRNVLKMPDTTSALTIGVTPPTSSSAGTGIWVDRTGLYSLASDIRQVWIDAATGIFKAGDGNVSIDDSGISIVGSPVSDPLSYNKISFLDSATGATVGSIYEYSSGTLSALEFVNVLRTGGNSSWIEMTANATNLAGAGYSKIALSAYGKDDASVWPASVLTLYNTNVYGARAELSVYDSLGGTYTSTIRLDKDGLNLLTGARMTLSLGERSGNPTFSSTDVKLWSRNRSLYALNQANVPINLTSVSNSGYLLPLFFYLSGAVWLTNAHGVIGTTFCGVDLGKNSLHLTPVNIGLSFKANPGGTIMGVFNGSSSYLYVPISYPINHPTDVGFGAWVYLDSVTRDHGIVRAGTAPVSWQISYRYISAANRYFELGYWDTGGVWRVLRTVQYSTVGWVYVGASISHGGPANNTQSLIINDQVSTVSNTGYAAPRAGTGNFQLGISGDVTTYYLLGKMITAWCAGNPLQNHIDYYNATQGYFQY